MSIYNYCPTPSFAGGEKAWTPHGSLEHHTTTEFHGPSTTHSEFVKIELGEESGFAKQYLKCPIGTGHLTPGALWSLSARVKVTSVLGFDSLGFLIEFIGEGEPERFLSLQEGEGESVLNMLEGFSPLPGGVTAINAYIIGVGSEGHHIEGYVDEIQANIVGGEGQHAAAYHDGSQGAPYSWEGSAWDSFTLTGEEEGETKTHKIEAHLDMLANLRIGGKLNNIQTII